MQQIQISPAFVTIWMESDKNWLTGELVTWWSGDARIVSPGAEPVNQKQITRRPATDRFTNQVHGQPIIGETIKTNEWIITTILRAKRAGSISLNYNFMEQLHHWWKPKKSRPSRVNSWLDVVGQFRSTRFQRGSAAVAVLRASGSVASCAPIDIGAYLRFTCWQVCCSFWPFLKQCELISNNLRMNAFMEGHEHEWE